MALKHQIRPNLKTERHIKTHFGIRYVCSTCWRNQLETFLRYWPFVRGIPRWPLSFPHIGQWRVALMFSLFFTWINGWVNNREADNLRCNSNNIPNIQEELRQYHGHWMFLSYCISGTFAAIPLTICHRKIYVFRRGDIFNYYYYFFKTIPNVVGKSNAEISIFNRVAFSLCDIWWLEIGPINETVHVTQSCKTF